MVRRGSPVRSVLAVLLVALLAVLSTGIVSGGGSIPAVAPTTVDRCTEINEPGVYRIGEEFAGAGYRPSVPCIRITADNVVLQGDGRVLEGLGATNTTGVQIIGADNVTVRNLRVSDWQRGIHYENASNVKIRNVTVTSNVYGVTISNSSGTALVGANVSANLVGFRFEGDTSTRSERIVTASNRIDGVHEEVEVRGYGIKWTYGPPLDYDGDGHYDDVTGDGDRTIDDRLAVVVIVTADSLGTTDLSDDQVEAFDFDDDGELGLGDVLAF